MTVRRIPPALRRLGELARNVWWSWHPEARALFKSIDPVLWRQSRYNPVRLLAEVPAERLAEVAQDGGFVRCLAAVLETFDAEMIDHHGWCATAYPALAAAPLAYFSFEYGVHGSLPSYAGGLGILAGDIAKEASDLGLSLVAVGFMYPQGYFHQHVNPAGRQEEVYEAIDRRVAPVEPACTLEGVPCVVGLHFPDRELRVAVWRVDVGRSRLLLMDTDLPDNAPWDRELSARLYGGDQELRLRQELVLGIGGVRILRALGIEPRVWHANEGHTAFMLVERVRERMAAGLDLDRALAAVRATSVFTTHTPVPAGQEAFPLSMVDQYLRHVGAYWPSLGLGADRERLLALALHQEPWGTAFNLTALALRLADHRNAVSRRHGAVSRRMWRGLWPDTPEDAVPIIAITNGVHVPTWVADEMDELYQRYLGDDWVRRHEEPGLWSHVADIPDAELWQARCALKQRLARYLRERARRRWVEHRGDPGQVLAAGPLVDADALTLGFARRFAAYKRATLVLRDPKRLRALLTDPRRPVQLVFAGKAHPADEAGKQLLEQVYAAARDSELAGRVAFVEDYDLEAARYLVAGVDAWLNTPRPPMEASGTSGQKAALNGVPHLSVLDGWWVEGYDGTNGWAIGNPGEGPADPEARDAADAEALYRLLEEDVVRLYYDRGPDGVPRGWLRVVRRAIQTAAPTFSARRMVKEYAARFYAKAAAAGASAS
ncbi:MAG: alpha-glucan family phosphorylase [Candidatus Rokubacteria bacterium]|nr:alpha-glucan family phosphorylase [Candidatus Rokubacteria bacterium]